MSRCTFSFLRLAGLVFLCSSCANVESMRNPQAPQRLTACKPASAHVAAPAESEIVQTQGRFVPLALHDDEPAEAQPKPAEAQNPEVPVPHESGPRSDARGHDSTPIGTDRPRQ